MKYKVKYLIQLTDYCPTQWEGLLDDNRPFFIHYRGGCLSVDLNTEPVTQEHIDSVNGKDRICYIEHLDTYLLSPKTELFDYDIERIEIFNECVGDRYDGEMELDELKQHIPDWDFSNVTEINKYNYRNFEQYNSLST